VSGRAEFEAAPGRPAPSRPAPGVVLELLKPITWFPPMWAFLCGAVSSGAPMAEGWPLLLAGLVLAGPLVCGMSQAVNDWFDRHVDAINEPHRPFPSGRMPGRWGLHVALGWTGVSLAWGAMLGLWGFLAKLLGVALA
jgi:chlorophyll synthase